MQRSRHYNAWYCAWKACEKLEGLLALSQAIWPAGQEWESGLQEKTGSKESEKVKRGGWSPNHKHRQVLYAVTKRHVDWRLLYCWCFQCFHVLIQATMIDFAEKIVWNRPMVFIMFKWNASDYPEKMNYLLVGLRGNCWRKGMILLPLKRRGPMWAGSQSDGRT